MRSSVDLPQPDGPINAPVSPSSSANERSAIAGTLCPEAVRKDFSATRASSRTRSPPGDMTFKGLHRKRVSMMSMMAVKGKRVSEQQRDVEQLESCIGFRTPRRSVGPSARPPARSSRQAIAGRRGSPRRNRARAAARRHGRAASAARSRTRAPSRREPCVKRGASPSRMVTTVTGELLSATAPIAAASLRPAQM